MKRFVAALLVGLLLPVLALAQTTGVPKPKLSSTNFGNTTSTELRSVISDPTGSGSLYFQGGNLGTPSGGVLTNATGLPIATGVSGLGTGVAAALGVNVGSAGAPVLFGGALGTPASGTLTNATGLPVASGISGMGSGVATFLATPSSANLLAAVTGGTGSGALVFGTSPTLAGGTVTSDSPALSITQTWNSGAATFTGLKQNITNTASSASSLLIDLQVGGTSAVKFGLDNAYWKTVTSIGPSSYKSSVDYEIRDVNGDNYTEIRLGGATNPTANFFAAYTTGGVGFIEQWTESGGSSIAVDPKPTDGTGTSLVAINRNTTTSGNSGLEIYQGNGSGSLNTYLSGKPAVNSYIAALSGNGKFGIGLTSPSATLHVMGLKGSAAELARYSATDATLGASVMVNDGGATAVGLRNRYTGSTSAAITFGFGGTPGTFDVLNLTRQGATFSTPVAGTSAITSSGATNGIGYATGAGGTATQSTDKSTTVVLSRATGQITMNAATLNANTSVSFTLTNTAVGTTDMVLCQHISGGTVGAYTVTCAPGSGSATVTVRNITGGNLGEAIVIQFTVIKAVTASNDNVPVGVELMKVA